MSLAVSADIKPSKLLFAIMSLACLVVAIGGGAACFLMASGLGVVARIALTLLCIFAAVIAMILVVRARKTVWLHISGAGQIRVVEHYIRDPKAKPQVMKAGLAQLQPGTTVWPGLMFLRLRLETGRMQTIPIFADSVPKDTFRALSVACRWLMSRNAAKVQSLEK